MQVPLRGAQYVLRRDSLYPRLVGEQIVLAASVPTSAMHTYRRHQL